ncbi:helix-turn-helix domain-containing protein [Apilactobacillus timberlakei]|uniref:Helix-turn-helix domain-containing protein n=1 Tax=Apilactobacillus timberlakei TaxID=2008380 RepID=A0ABY2YST5_9LACO|nr:helix-turn-helix domain-containing protein [Apilactobacillus timberlakei]TPR13264.1 helix-turn-helix domain-containing protein [Apilactobacillus timberlakei]TPR14300.1 helix-turn-helix domain-containing protein [Apilactobacillus timberlakei]TPR16553.1 helix-turn-helix domain-containing protein [Apilactobacillus timberlakei]TPR19240.1 helix-turn-helix domain-containing protein [Apilactobacillus timberlakei]
MDLGRKIKQGRRQFNFTQQELADQLHVTRQALSKWENNLSYPNLDMLVDISKSLNISLNELLGEEDKMIKQISNDVRSKHKYMKYLYIVSGIFILFIVMSVTMFLFLYGKETNSVATDRFNPALKTEIGYAILPEKTPIKREKVKFHQNDKQKTEWENVPQNIYAYVYDNAKGNGEYLKFATGLYNKDHRWAKITHKGTYVSKASLITKDDIPKNIAQNMSNSYSNYGVKK